MLLIFLGLHDLNGRYEHGWIVVVVLDATGVAISRVKTSTAAAAAAGQADLVTREAS